MSSLKRGDRPLKKQQVANAILEFSFYKLIGSSCCCFVIENARLPGIKIPLTDAFLLWFMKR